MRRALLLAVSSVLFTTTLAATPPRTLPLARLAVAAHEAGRPILAGADGRVPITLRIPAGVAASDLGAMEVAPGIGFRRVLSSELSAFVATHHDLQPSVSPPLKALLDQAGRWTGATSAHAPGVGASGKGTIVGIVDTGLDLAHRDLQNADGTTRVAWLLDLAAKPTGKHPELEQKFGCTDPALGPCAVLSGADIDALIAAKATLPTDVIGHGTHAAAIAAGNGGGTPFIGMAPSASLVIARVTRDAGDGAITDGDILNAVRFVFDRADAAKQPAVVNVSLGGDFGPHDGTSPLEAGLSALVGPDHPGRSVVTAAGNSAGILVTQDGRLYGSHTEARSIRGTTTRVVLQAPSAGISSQGSAYVWINFRAGDDVRVGVDIGGSVALDPLGRGEQGARDHTASTPYVAVLNGVVGPKSPINAGTRAAVVVVDGAWESATEFGILLEGDGMAELWVQGSGDAATGSVTGGELFRNATKQGTINVPASAPALIAVGCTINRLAWNDPAHPPPDGITVSRVGADDKPEGDSACYFSAAGPNADGVPKPEISAPGAFVASAMSVDADPRTNPSSIFTAPAGRCPKGDDQCYIVDPTHAIASGTSFSAPMVAGAVALLFEREPTLTQPEIVALLQGGARKFEGKVPYDYQVGPGALNIIGSFAALAERGKPAMLVPEPTKSWVTLSAGYLRPDPTWPLTVTVEARASDAQPADGFDPRKLTLVLENARARTPLHRVGPGLWEAEITGLDETGGEEARVAVLWDGAPIASRTLPISVDWWAKNGAADARGGCAIAAAAAPARATTPLTLVLAAIGGALIRGRRRASRRAARTALRRVETAR